ncbi:MAG: ABC transporter ATP-binding protein [Gammaproteobacteria bacterium]
MINNNQPLPNTLITFIKHFFKSYRSYFVLMILVDVISILCIIIQPYIVKKLIDAATLFLGKETLIKVTLLPGGLLIALSISAHLVWRFNNYVCLKAIPTLKANIIDEVSGYVHKHSFKFFQDNLSGAVSNKIVDIANNSESLIYNSRTLFRNLIMLIGTILMSLVVNPFFSIIFLVTSILFIIASFYISNKIEPFSKTFAESRSHAIGNIVDSFVNVMNVILFARSNYEKQYLQGSLNDMVIKDQRFQQKLMQYGFIMSSLSVLTQVLIIALLIYFGAKGALTAGDFVLIFMLTFSGLEHIWMFSEMLFKIAEQVGVFKQALQFISTPLEIIDADNATPLKVDTGTIVFSRVKFFYTESQQLFEDKTLVINGGEKVGLVGSSGSGKSSFVNLITRIFDIQSGSILIDNQPVNLVTLQSLRENIAFIPQEPVLFHRTIIDNIRYGGIEASDEEITEIAKKAHIHEFIIELPEGYQTLVGERGVKLSGGQRQRIAIARAMLKNAPILILDEATSALDSVTESLIQESLKYAMKNKTVIVIAHRLSTIKAMDRILVFDKGRIVEEGTHEYLLEKGQIYKNLWQTQASTI